MEKFAFTEDGLFFAITDGSRIAVAAFNEPFELFQADPKLILEASMKQTLCLIKECKDGSNYRIKHISFTPTTNEMLIIIKVETGTRLYQCTMQIDDLILKLRHNKEKCFSLDGRSTIIAEGGEKEDHEKYFEYIPLSKTKSN